MAGPHAWQQGLQANDPCVVCRGGCNVFTAVLRPGRAPELSRDLGIGESRAALAVSAATLGLACSVLVWSLLADRMGRLRTMTIAVVCAVLLGLAVPFSPGFEWLLALRFIEGLALGGIPAVALAYLAEEVSHLHAAVAGTKLDR